MQCHILTCPNSQSLNCLNLLLYHIKMCSCQKAPLSYFSFQPVLHDWFNKSRGMHYPVCGMMHIKEPLLLIGKSSLCGGSGFPLSLSEWSFTICVMPYNRKYNVFSVSLNKIFSSFLPCQKAVDRIFGCQTTIEILKLR